MFAVFNSEVSASSVSSANGLDYEHVSYCPEHDATYSSGPARGPLVELRGRDAVFISIQQAHVCSSQCGILHLERLRGCLGPGDSMLNSVV